MRALIQRVKEAQVVVDGKCVSKTGHGLLTLLAVGPNDGPKQVEWMVKKIIQLRIFEDSNAKMNLSLQEIGGSHLVVSQFTLYADCRKGNRPSFIQAAKPEHAKPLVELFIEKSRAEGVNTESGQFGADMKVSLINDGPVTLWIESEADE